MKKDVEHFRVELKREGAANSTINNRVAAVRRFYEELVINKYDFEINFFKKIKKLSENTNSYGFFTVEEVDKLINLAQKEKFNGEVKAFFIAFCVETSIRKQAALDLKWSDFEIKN